MVRIGCGVWDIAMAEGGAVALLAPRSSRERSYAKGTPLVEIFASKWVLFNLCTTRMQLAVLVLAMLGSCLAAIVSLGAVLPFLAVVTNPGQLWQPPLIQGLALWLG
jgi:hypothetical protein